jgi:hypothetical protein
VKAGDDTVFRTCPQCGEVNGRATGIRALWTNPRNSDRCQFCSCSLDVSKKPSTVDRVIGKVDGAMLHAAYYGLHAMVGFAVLFFGTAILAGWAMPNPVARYVYFGMGCVGAVAGLYKADRARRRGEIFVRRPK